MYSLVEQWDEFVHSEGSPLIICTLNNCPVQQSAVSNDPASGNNPPSMCQAKFGAICANPPVQNPWQNLSRERSRLDLTWESLHKPLVISGGPKRRKQGYTSAWSGLGMPPAPVPASLSALAPLDQVTPLPKGQPRAWVSAITQSPYEMFGAPNHLRRYCLSPVYVFNRTDATL